MIHSMTAFARKQQQASWGTATWEIRSVNQRFLETYFRLPETFRMLEPVLRERLRKQLQRGKIECTLRFNNDGAETGTLTLNKHLAKQVIEAADWIQAHAETAAINPLDVLKWPGVVATEEADLDKVQAELLHSFDATVGDFITARATEGSALKAMLETRLDNIQTEAQQVAKHMPTILKWQKDKLINRFAEAELEPDHTRVEHELVILAQKLDVAEEIDRLNAHVKETRNILKKGGACGRRLDFMMQEFNREANTLGSKSINTDITQAAVEIKVLIEQMREQIQNIE